MSGRSARRSPVLRFVAWARGHAAIVASIAIAAILLGVAIAVFGPPLMRPAGETARGPDGAATEPADGSSLTDTPSVGPSQTPSAKPSPSATGHGGPPVTIGPPPSATGFPDASNTGIPRGTALSNYTGSCTITTNNLVIDGKVFNCSVSIRAKAVVIKRSKINGQLGTNEGTAYSFTLQDSEVDAGVVQGAVVGSTNMTILRSNIHGGATSVYCYSNCTLRDSYLHGQRLPAGVDWHLGAFLANDNGNDPGGRTNAWLVHNTIICDARPNSADGGCSGNINLYGDFGPITYVTLDNNLFGANTGVSYCVYGGQSTSKPYPNADHVVVVNNVFQRGSNGKCGNFGPVTAFDTARPGNRWENNVWDNGATVRPAN